jgi:hypothetical protein
MTHIPDHLPTLLTLAADSGGLTISACELITSTSEAGLLDSPLREARDLTATTVAATYLLVAEIDWRSIRVMNGLPQIKAAKRVRIAAALVGLLLPPVRRDEDARYALVPDADGYLPTADEVLTGLHQAAQRVETYLDEHTLGEWVDPSALAGAVADVHDAARMLVALLECGGSVSLMDLA